MRAPAQKRVEAAAVQQPHADTRPSYGIAAIVAAVILALYIATLAPSTAMWDTGEYMAAVKDLGIPHPPGNPLFMLLGHIFGLLPIGGYAARINVLAAVSSAVTAGFWFLITERVLARWLERRWERVLGACAAALIGATAFTVWNQSVVNEKVYTLALAIFALVAWLMVCWTDNPDGPRSDAILLVVAYLIGLGYTNHPAGFLPLPAVGVAILVRRWRTLLRWRLMLGVVCAIALGLTAFAYEPIRAAYFPHMNEGEPTACESGIGVSCTFSGVTAQRLADNITRAQYGEKVGRGAPFADQIATWWLYFQWQWLRDPDGTRAPLQSALAMIFFALGIAGAYVHWKRDRDSFWLFATLIFTLTLPLIYYLNFKYGFSQSPQLGESVDREVRDRDYFYIWSFSAWSVWAALGLTLVWRWIARSLATRTGESEMRASLLATPVFALVLVPLLGNWSAASHRGQTFTRDWAADILNSVEPYGVLITNGDNDTFPLWYAQEVEGIRPDVTVVVTTYLDIDWMARELTHRTAAPYDAAHGPAIYRDRAWPAPTGHVLPMSIAQTDSIPDYVQLAQPMLFTSGGIRATVKPGYLTRGQIVTLDLIRSSGTSRSIFFSAGGTYAQDLGLGDYLLGEGLVRKLVDHPITASADTVKIGGGFVDVPGSLARWNMYRAPAALARQGAWTDPASVSIPANYAVTGYILAQALVQRGDSAAAAPIMNTVANIVKIARLQ